ncbi:MAG: transketolase [Dehalococcoidia bacterium]|nr:transketolase [Dehalococcoidia bacterium]MQG15595.1 transketolase family protein [SAR202 cluster bacterium]|tara:strand:- start:20559 stop:21497 length:939 start_codon:yes stop_codon:yes gene_type:complete
MANLASTREVAGDLLVKLGHEYADLVVVGGDLNKSTFANKFQAEFPDRFFDFGPAEQNMVSVAAGLAASGKIPVVSTFAVFGTARPFDQLRVGVSQSRLNVKLILTHSGLLTAEDGVSAQSIEDIAIMSALPSFTVIVPADGPETEHAIKAALDMNGPVYIRLSRPATPIVHTRDYNFKIGAAEVMREGDDVTIVSYGIMVNESLKAAADLDQKGISSTVINMATVAPLDEAAILSSVSRTGLIVTAEEHLIQGGLGSMVASLLAQNSPAPLEMVGLRGYAESGKPEQLLKKYHLTQNDIVESVLKGISRKS